MKDASAQLMGQAVASLQNAFSSGLPQPPLGGGADVARLFGGAGIPSAAWLGHDNECRCCQPMLWVRPRRWWYSETFGSSRNNSGMIGASGSVCGVFSVLDFEMGIFRCSPMDAVVSWEAYEDQALVECDDARRLRAALCHALRCAEADGYVSSYSMGETQPTGPEGGVIGVVTVASAVIKG